MAASSVNYPIKLAVRPDLEAAARPRARMLGQTVSGLISILVWNDHVAPRPGLAPLPNPQKLIRVDLTISLRVDLRAIAEESARAQVMSLNAYLEALLAADLSQPDRNLTILATP